jgi:hypothetical protein
MKRYNIAVKVDEESKIAIRVEKRYENVYRNYFIRSLRRKFNFRYLGDIIIDFALSPGT